MVTLASSAPQSLVEMEEKGRVAPACCLEDSNLVSAAIEGDLEKVTNMLRFVDPNSAKMTVRHNVKQKTYPLHEAARRGHVKIMMVLIAAGADVDLQIERNNVDLWDTVLHIAVYHGHLSAAGLAIVGEQSEPGETKVIIMGNNYKLI